MLRVQTALSLMVALACCAHAPASPFLPAPTSLARSNAFAARLLDVDGSFDPEETSTLGVGGLDEQISRPEPGCDERALTAYRSVREQFRAAMATESDPAVRLDLELLADAAERKRHRLELQMKYGVPDLEAADTILEGITGLLDDQVPPGRRAAALVRLRKYAGLEPGTTPFAELVKAHVKERLARSPKPFVLRARVERYLDGWRSTLGGLGPLFARYGLSGAEQALAALEQQLADYDSFLRKDVLPGAQSGFLRPEELYAFELLQAGIDVPPRQLAAMARAEFREIQSQLQAAAGEVAARRGLSSRDYRDVLRSLKADQVEGPALVALYQQRIRELDALIAGHDLVSLPKRPLRFRLATEAESGRFPAPRYQPPPLLSNHGEEGTFILPQTAPGAGRLDDFSSEASSWWLAAHEGRPGHDLQYSRMVETGVSVARGIYAFNSLNAEGWGLYAEWLIEPYVPVEGRLAILQARLMRAAHAFLDPEVNLGLISLEEARRVITEDVVFSEAWASSSVQRYSVWLPGQAPSYYCGYLRLRELRRDAEAAWGKDFSARRFHDAVISQGLLPPALLRRVVLGTALPRDPSKTDDRASR